MTASFSDLPEAWPLLIGAALVMILLAESAYVLFSRANQYRANVNRRLRLQAEVTDRAEALLQLKRERGIGEGSGSQALDGLLTLIRQSGLRIGLRQVALLWALSVMIGPIVPIALSKGEPLYLLAGFAGGLLLPLLVLRYLRNRRIKRFAEQFADAIDIIVRSLKAGHPLPIAINLVAREMPDPVGTEFGMVADELAFGLDLESAMRNLCLRVGQEDLPLFVTSIAIQAATGGNLAAILEGLSKLIRDRFKMRRKIRAISSEARMSANVLIALPFFVFFAVQAIEPHFFDAARGKEETTTVIIFCFCWMSIGVMAMRKLVAMKI
jgi:tight adherence protein B